MRRSAAAMLVIGALIGPAAADPKPFTGHFPDGDRHGTARFTTTAGRTTG